MKKHKPKKLNDTCVEQSVKGRTSDLDVTGSHTGRHKTYTVYVVAQIS